MNKDFTFNVCLVNQSDIEVVAKFKCMGDALKYKDYLTNEQNKVYLGSKSVKVTESSVLLK